MKKKSLYDIAMERKDKTSEVQEQIVIERKRTILLVIVDIIEKILKLLFYIVLFFFVSLNFELLFNFVPSSNTCTNFSSVAVF